MTALHPTDGLLPGFNNPVMDGQRVFRAVLEAMSRPGTIVELPLAVAAPPPLNPASAAILLALCDFETPVWLDPAAGSDALVRYLRFHCGCPLAADPALASFAVIAQPAAMPPLAAFHAGSDEFPDQSTTLIVQVDGLRGGPSHHLQAGYRLTGPGIREAACLAAAGLPAEFREWVKDNHGLFPQGVDLIFTDGRALAALPRSTRLED